MASVPQTNALGYLIGGEADEATMVVALSSTGQLRRIAEVPRGFACACTCLECGGGVIARKGEMLAHHFAHVAGEPCNGSETQAHLFAKSVIEKARSVHLPSLDTYGLINPELQLFEQIDLEKRYSQIRPDLIATWKDRLLLIEIRVTHAVDFRKREWLQQNRLSCIEIDLRKLRWKPDEELAPAILRTAPRRWISHRTEPVPEAPLPLGKVQPSGGLGRAGRIQSNANWYAAETAKEFPNLEQSWREARKRWGFE